MDSTLYIRSVTSVDVVRNTALQAAIRLGVKHRTCSETC